MAAQVAKFATQLGWNLALARILVPADFGVYAMATPVIAISLLVQDLGITQAVVTAKEVNQRALSTLFYLNLAASAAVSILLLLLAPSIAAFYGEPRIYPVILMMAGTVFVAAASSVHRALLTRDLRYGRIAQTEVFSTFVGSAASIYLAFVIPGPLALTSTYAISALVLLICSWASTRWMPGKPAPFSEMLPFIKFGGGLTGFNLTNFVARSADNVIIGKFLGEVQLGFYDRAYKLMLLPLQQVSNPANRVMVPILSKLVDEPERYRFAYLRTVRTLLLVTLPGVVFFSVAADPLVPVLLGENWRPAAEIFTWLSIAALHQPLTVTTGWLFVSQSRTGAYAKLGLFNAVTCLAAFFAGLPWGAVGVAACYAISDIAIRMPALYWLVGREGPVRTKDIYGVLVPNAVAILITGAALIAAKAVLVIGDLPLLGTLALLSYCVFWAVLAFTKSGRNTFAQIARVLWEPLRKPNSYPAGV